MAQKKIIAISEADFKGFGCVACGLKDGHDGITGESARLRTCSCGVKFIILVDGVTSSPISSGGLHFPSLSKHPMNTEKS